MRRYTNNHLSFAGVAVGALATMDLETEHIYHGVDLYYRRADVDQAKAVILTDIEYIEVLINGTVQRRFTPAQLFLIDEFKGGTFVDGRIPIRFSEPHRVTPGGEDGTAWGMAGVGQFTLRVKIDPAAVTPQLDLKRNYNVGDLPLGAIVSYIEEQVEATGAGVKKHSYRGSGRVIPYMHAFAANATGIKILRGDTVLIEATKTELDTLYADHGFVPQAGVLHICPEAFTGRLGDVIDLINPATGRPTALNFEFTMSGAETFPMIIEEIGPRKS